MDTLRLDYQTTARRPRPLPFLLLLGSVFAAIFIATEYQTLQQQIDKHSTTLKLEHQSQNIEPQHSKQELHLSEALKKSQANIMERLSLPWVPLFQALESARDPKILLLSIEPNIKTGMVRITAQTDSLEQALIYLNKLQQQSALSAVTLTEHEIELEMAGQPVRFTLNLAWINAR